MNLRDRMPGGMDLGPLTNLLASPGVSDVLVNGSSSLWVEQYGRLRELSNPFPDADSVRSYAATLVRAVGKHVDLASPIVDAELPCGIRLHVALPPIAVDGPYLSLRVPTRPAWSLQELTTAGMLTPFLAVLLRAAVRGRANVLVTGATGAGKTSLLSALIGEVPADERIIAVEDVAELRTDHPHFLSLQTRQQNTEGRGGVVLEELVRATLRMRPDRVVVGECRGSELVDLLAALNAGHAGSLATLHAGGVEQVPARLASIALRAGVPPEWLALEASSAVDVIVHVERRGERRLVAEVGTLSADSGGLKAHRVGRVTRSGVWETEPGWATLTRRWSDERV